MTTNREANRADYRDYERYAAQAKVTQDLKRIITHHVADLDHRLDDDMQEALDAISFAIGMIIQGYSANPLCWISIVDNALPVANRLSAENSEVTND